MRRLKNLAFLFCLSFLMVAVAPACSSQNDQDPAKEQVQKPSESPYDVIIYDIDGGRTIKRGSDNCPEPVAESGKPLTGDYQVVSSASYSASDGTNKGSPQYITAQIGSSDPDPGEDPDPTEEPPGEWFQNLWSFLLSNWAELILGLLFLIETIVRLTPTERDDSWFNWLKNILDAILPSKIKTR